MSLSTALDVKCSRRKTCLRLPHSNIHAPQRKGRIVKDLSVLFIGFFENGRSESNGKIQEFGISSLPARNAPVHERTP